MPPLLPTRPQPVRILVVDDDDVFSGSLSAILSGNPRFVVVGRAADGVQGIELALRLRPDVILMDVNMPRLDGFGATKLIRERLPDVRIVIISGDPEPEHLAAARIAGADVYLRKDCGFDALEDAVTESDALVAKLAVATAW